LRAAGLDPAGIRANAVAQYWDRDVLHAKLRDFATAKRENRRLEMPNELRNAIRRYYGSLDQAAVAAGVEPDAISIRALFTGRKVEELAEDLRQLVQMKGRERRERLREIYHRNPENKRIIQNYFLSLRRLAEAFGIDPKAVAIEAYRDEADVHHDLDVLEKAGKPLCFQTLRRGYKRLYNVIRETGWGQERLSGNSSTFSADSTF
jgi:hypothetical protein